MWGGSPHLQFSPECWVKFSTLKRSNSSPPPKKGSQQRGRICQISQYLSKGIFSFDVCSWMFWEVSVIKDYQCKKGGYPGSIRNNIPVNFFASQIRVSQIRETLQWKLCFQLALGMGVAPDASDQMTPLASWGKHTSLYSSHSKWPISAVRNKVI